MSVKRILCVEDHEDICNLISVIFKNIEVLSVSNVADALKIASPQNFDLYLLDYALPDKTGMELASLIRESDAKTPILFVTGSNLITEEKAIENGAQGLIRKGTKSFIEDLENKVQQALSGIINSDV